MNQQAGPAFSFQPAPVRDREYVDLVEATSSVLADDNVVFSVRDDIYGGYGYQTSPTGSKTLIDAMHTHPAGYIKDTDMTIILGLEIFLGTLPKDDARQSGVKKILSYWYGANSLKQVDRFLDERQKPLFDWPRGNGSNLRLFTINPSATGQFEREWTFRRLFTRALHYPGLIKLNGDDEDLSRIVHIMNLLFSARLLLEHEHQEIKPHTIAPGSPNEFNYNSGDPRATDLSWIKDSRAIIDAAVKEIFDTTKTPIRSTIAFVNKRRADGYIVTDAEIATANFNNEHLALLQAINEKMNTRLQNNPFERLILDLLDTENTFERLLSVEHVDDKLIDKQISWLDEEDNVQSRGVLDVSRLDYRARLYEENAYKIMHDIAFVNRQRRNFRLFKDWHEGHRPWAKMFLVYDSSLPDYTWSQLAIEKFRHRLLVEEELDNPTDVNWKHPTAYRRLAPYLFDINPIDTNGDDNRMECSLCKLPLYPKGVSPPPLDPNDPDGERHELYDPTSPLANTATMLLCYCVFHTTCIFKHWDQPNEYTHTCPDCQRMAPLNWGLAALPPLDIATPTPGNPNPPNTFAHNTFAHHRAELLFSNKWSTKLLSQDTEDVKKYAFGKALYDLPRNDVDYSALIGRNRQGPGKDRLADLLAAQYWARENMASLLFAASPVSWVSQRFAADERPQYGGPPRQQPVRNPTIGGAILNPLGLPQQLQDPRSLGQTLGNRWMQMQHQPDPNLPNYNPNVYDYSQVRWLTGARHSPTVEAAELRRRRRQRNKARRERAQAAGAI